MALIVLGAVAIFILTSLRAVKVKSFKVHLLIDGVLLALMLLVVVLKRFVLGAAMCWAILLLWIAAGTIVRKYYSKFDFCFQNKLCKLFKTPPYTSIEQMEEDATLGNRFSAELLYYAIEAMICVLIVIAGTG